ncbi:MAG: helix-turn-helix domain-containing protein [Clostridiales bacterium]|nr:helix-turn-helix domain-containing protein [Clostridiales bacterium]
MLRALCNLTQKNLGDIVGVSRQTITNIESGKSKMQWTLFLALMLVFGLNKNCMNYIKEMKIPYSQVKEVLANKIGKAF